MSIRVLLFWIFVVALAIYAWKDWFISLCGLIVLMAILEHPDMPRSIMGVQGLNLWNILMAAILAGWFIQRRAEGIVWDMPRFITVLLILYLIVIIVGFFRAVFDRSFIEDYPLANMISEEFINTLKWVIPGILVYDGVRNYQRLRLVIFAILLLYTLFAMQVIISVPIRVLWEGKGLSTHARLKIEKRMGYQPVDMSTIMAGASWTILGTMIVIKKWRYRIFIIGAAVITAIAQAVTGGRAGYAAWVGVGLLLCMLRWRWYLLLTPIIPIVFAAVFPAATARITQGLSQMSPSGHTHINEYKLTSGRSIAWPMVIEKIEKAPMLGYGRLAMRRTGLTYYLWENLGENFPHPHNIYLEWLLDNGIIGFIPVLIFFTIVVVYSTRLFVDKANPWYALTGCMCFSLVVAQLIAGLGSQHFYPTEGTVGMWCAIFLMFRVYFERQRVQGQARLPVKQFHYARVHQSSR